MTDDPPRGPQDEPARRIVSVDWRSVGLAAAIIAAIALAGWLTWAVLSFLFGTTLGRALVGLGVAAAALYVILTDDEVDLDDALNDEAPPSDDSEDDEKHVCADCGREFDSSHALAGHRSVHGGDDDAE